MQNFEILIYLEDINYKVDFAMKKIIEFKNNYFTIFFQFYIFATIF